MLTTKFECVCCGEVFETPAELVEHERGGGPAGPDDAAP